MWKWVGMFLRKNHLLRCWNWLSLLNCIGVLTLSLLLKQSPRKIGSLIRSIKFLSPEVAHQVVTAGLVPLVPRCPLLQFQELLESLQKRICSSAGPSLAASLEPLAHRRNVTSLSLFFSVTLVDVLQNRFNWFHFLFLGGDLIVILIDCMIFLSPFHDFSVIIARIWNSLAVECFPST